MGDAGAGEAESERSMTAAEEEAATAEEEEEVALVTLARAVSSWLQATNSASKKRRSALRTSENTMKTQLNEMKKKIQEMGERVEKIERMPKLKGEKLNERCDEKMSNRIRDTEQKYLHKKEKKPFNAAVETKPRISLIDVRQGNSLPRTSPEKVATSVGAKRPRASSSDSTLHFETPSKSQRNLQGNATPTMPAPDPDAQPSAYISIPSLPSPSVVPHLDRRQISLRSAVKCGRLDDVLNYLEIVTDINFLDEEGDTLLHVAAKNSRGKILKVLLSKGRMQVDAVDSAGQTALHAAALSSKGSNCVDILFRYKADVNVRDSKGNSPLHCAVRSRNEAIVKKLLAKGADPNITNNDGEKPFDVDKADVTRTPLQTPNVTSPPADGLWYASDFVSTSMDFPNERNVEENEIYLD